MLITHHQQNGAKNHYFDVKSRGIGMEISLFSHVDWGLVETMVVITIITYILMRLEMSRQRRAWMHFIHGMFEWGKRLGEEALGRWDETLEGSGQETLSEKRSRAGQASAASKKEKKAEKNLWENINQVVDTVADAAETVNKIREVADKFAPKFEKKTKKDKYDFT